MKRWAVLTAALYALALILLTAPVIFLAAGNWWGRGGNGFAASEIFNIFKAWQFWLWLGVLVGGQVLLLLVPIDLSQKRLPSRRKLKVPVIVSAFFLANLLAAGVFAAACAIFTDGTFNFFTLTDWLLGHQVNNQPGTIQTTDAGVWTTIGLTIGILWLVWAIVFSRYAKSDDPDALVKRAMRWLLRGSILDLLVAVPSHIVARRRDDCCAPGGTFWGITTGLSVMLLCFGPGVFFLFVERFQRLKPKDLKPDETNLADMP